MNIKLVLLWLAGLIWAFFILTSDAHAADVTIEWDYPEQREDGTPLELYEIEGYLLFTVDPKDHTKALSSPIEIKPSDIYEYTITILAYGEYCFALVTVDTNGIKSQWSEVICGNNRSTARPQRPVIRFKPI